MPDVKDSGPNKEGDTYAEEEPNPEKIVEHADTSEEADPSMDEPAFQREDSHAPSAVHHEVLASPVMADALLQPQMSLNLNGGSVGSSEGVTECLFGTKLRCKGSNIVTTCDRSLDHNSPLYPHKCYYGDSDVTEYMTCCTLCCARSWSNDVHNWCSDITYEDLTCPLNDCSQLQMTGVDRSGAYLIQPGPTPRAEMVWCDMETEGGGWTIIQSRIDGSVDFDRLWEDYERSFGTAGSNFWLGLRNIHLLTRKPMELYISVEDFDGKSVFARYERFSVGSAETNYILGVSNYFGNAGDSMNPSGHSHVHLNGMMFTTSDRENDNRNGLNCADRWGGPWWHNDCGWSSLNGKYFPESSHTEADGHGIRWNTLISDRHSLKQTKMMIRPVN